MAQERWDMLVVGSGPGGQQAAVTAAKLGKRVGLVERKPYLGGVSLQTGTIPSKALREAAFLVSRFAAKGMREALVRSPGLGRDFLAEAIHKKDAVVASQESLLLSQLMAQGITIIPGEAGFLDAHSLEVRTPAGGMKTLSADTIVLATGSRPRRPKDVPFDKDRVLDSSSILNLRRLPQSLLVVGGGVIACEFATMFAPLGVEVTIIDSHARLLAYVDHELGDLLVEHMRDMGMRLHLNAKVRGITREGDQVELVTEADEAFRADRLLYAMGRQPNYEGLNIAAAGLAADDHGWVRINDDYQTSQPHIYIIGDLAGRPSLASTAMEQGRQVARHAFARAAAPTPALLPMAIYTVPELSYVGETEQELSRRGVDYVVGRARFAETARGQIIGDDRGLLKLLVERASHRLLGVHIIGESASELIHLGQLAMAAELGVDTLAANVFNYPTLGQCYKDAALQCLEHLSGT